ncbi:MAG: TIGR03557 family F420-dependent LLM class oxidoreductase [Actinomycetota bacterium]|nr:TIGR03557 family F420-dependent LLM class oxidoreductase [Actinomycetota bacterium]MDA3012920.1 TIGR03557 family F420-dependent LLM class oxidoreductase [Actinomycetota bacterium]
MTKFSYFLGSEQWQPEDLLKHAVLAKDAGFDMLTISEHFHPWVDDFSASNFTWSTLGALASSLPQLDLGTGVTTPLWRIHPGVIAQAAATIDRLTPKTFHLGVGTGENINEGPLGFSFPNYEERKDRLIEALKIIKSLFSGEKLTFDGKYYQTNKAKLYTPPLKKIPIWLAAGGPKSAQVAAEYADGLMISVKDPKIAYENVIDPARFKTKELKKDEMSVHTYRWTMFAESDEDAWTALRSWRGLRAPNRLNELDPEALRIEADSFPKEEIMSKFSRASSVDELVNIYKPLVKEFNSEIITIQISSINQEETIQLLGKELLPRLKK